MKYWILVFFFSLHIITTAQNTYSISGVEMDRNSAENTAHYDDQKNEVRSRANQGFTDPRVLSTPNPSVEAEALYRYLQHNFERKTLSGQQWVQWGINELTYIEGATGKLPAIAGFDYINESQNAVENQRAIEYWNNGGIVTIMYHQGAPSIGEGYENSKETIDINQVFIEGTPEYVDFWGDLERIGDYLQELENANIPVLWRPFHELTGNWFWWSKGGPELFKQLWIAMYDYYVTERELNNLIWVLCYTDQPKNGDWFPGNEYVDIAGADTYDNLTDSHLSMYNRVLAAIDGNDYPIAFHENGNPPNPEDCYEDRAMWSWWMIWHTDWLTDLDENYIDEVYQSDLVITLDELPNIVEEYGGDDYVRPLAIDKDLTSSLIVFPSPVSSQLNVKLDPSVNKAFVKIFDLNGSLLLEDHIYNEQNTINVSSLQNGVYSLLVLDKNSISTHKFIKI